VPVVSDTDAPAAGLPSGRTTSRSSSVCGELARSTMVNGSGGGSPLAARADGGSRNSRGSIDQRTE
jgi:hypothetical protein